MEHRRIAAEVAELTAGVGVGLAGAFCAGTCFFRRGWGLASVALEPNGLVFVPGGATVMFLLATYPVRESSSRTKL